MKFNIGKVLAALFLLAFVAVVVPSSPAAVGPGGGGVFVPGGGAATNIINYYTPAVVNASATNVPAGFPATVSVTGTNIQTWVFGIPVGRDGTNGVNGINGTNGTGLTPSQTDTLNAAVTTSRNTTNILSIPDYNSIYVSGSTNSAVNGRYYLYGTINGASYSGCPLFTNGITNAYYCNQQLYTPTYTNAGFAIFKNRPRGSSDWGYEGDDVFLVKTNFSDRNTYSNLCYVLGPAEQFGQIGKVYQNGYDMGYVELNTAWHRDNANIVLYEFPNILNILYGGSDITTHYGTNLVTNVQSSLSFGTTNRQIWVDANYGNDSTGSIGEPRLPFRTMQAAHAVASLYGDSFTWHIARGNYQFFNWLWMPTNALVYADSDAVFFNTGNSVTGILMPFETFEMNGGMIYQDPAIQAGGPTFGLTTGITNITLRNFKNYSGHGFIQGTAPGLVSRFDNCELWSGSWTLETLGSANNWSTLYCNGTTVHENSWNSTESGGAGLYVVATAWCRAYVTGSTFIISNDFPQSFTSAAFFHGVTLATNEFNVAGTIMKYIGSNTNWLYFDTLPGTTNVYFGPTLPTNRIVGPIPTAY